MYSPVANLVGKQECLYCFLEGGQCLAVFHRERECIPQERSSVGKGSVAHSLFVGVSSSNTGQSKPALSSRTEAALWFMTTNQILKIFRGGIMKAVESQRQEFMLNPFFYMEPVEISQNRSNTICFLSSGDNSSSGILHTLEP